MLESSLSQSSAKVKMLNLFRAPEPTSFSRMPVVGNVYIENKWFTVLKCHDPQASHIMQRRCRCLVSRRQYCFSSLADQTASYTMLCVSLFFVQLATNTHNHISQTLHSTKKKVYMKYIALSSHESLWANFMRLFFTCHLLLIALY